MKFGLAFGLSLIVSLAATPIVIGLSTQLGVIDKPVNDRWHKAPTPRLGGIAIFIGFIVSALLLAPRDFGVVTALVASSAVFILGALDDKFGTYPGTKFIAQLVIAFTVVLLGVRVKIVPTALAIPLSLLWLVMLTNAFNLIDNMDGLSGGTATIASLALAGFGWLNGQVAISILGLSLAGACLGFLRYNFNGAKIFMGDCGSLFLGFILSTMAILGFWEKTTLPVFSALTVPVLILGYAIVDTILVTVLRLKSGGRPWVGGKDHSSHRLVGLGFSEKNAVLLLYGLSGVGALGAVGVYYAPSIIGLSLVFTLAVVAFGFGWFLDRKTPHKPLPKSLPHSPTIRAYSKTHAD